MIEKGSGLVIKVFMYLGLRWTSHALECHSSNII